MKIFYFSVILLLLVSCHNNQTNSSEQKYVSDIQKHKPVVSNQKHFDFENDEAGILPKDWSSYFTGKGQASTWEIINVDNNKALAQLSDEQPNYHFNVAVYKDLSAKNVDLSVRLKALHGQIDQGGGFVWRFKDADNYYVVRANPLEDNIVLYKVVNAKRTDLPVLGKGRTYGVDVPKLGNDWFDLRLLVQDDLFTVFLNGKQIFQVRDKTFQQAGKTGFWTKADAVTAFDDYTIKVLK